MKAFEVGKTYPRADGNSSIRLVANTNTECPSSENKWPLVGISVEGDSLGEVMCFTEEGGSPCGRQCRALVHPTADVVRWTFAVAVGLTFTQVYEYETEEEAVAEKESNIKRGYRCSEIVRLVWKVPL